MGLTRSTPQLLCNSSPNKGAIIKEILQSLHSIRMTGIAKQSLLKRKFQLLRFLAKEVERHAVIGGNAVLADCSAVLGCGVAFVALPVVHWIFLRKAHYVVIAVGLCKD